MLILVSLILYFNQLAWGWDTGRNYFSSHRVVQLYDQRGTTVLSPLFRDF